MKYIIEKITPEFASELLKKNSKNRKLRELQVRILSNAMVRGEWKTSPQPIIVDKQGNLLDGQHRLHAVVKSGVTIAQTVCYDADSSIFDVLDVGVKRDYSDITGLDRKTAQIITAMAAMGHSEISKQTHQQTHIFKDLFLDDINLIKNINNCNRKMFENSFFKAGAVFMAKKLNVHGHVESILKNITQMIYKDMSDVEMAFMRFYSRFLENNTHYSKIDTFCISCLLFDPSKKNRKRIKVHKDYVNDYLTYLDKISVE